MSTLWLLLVPLCCALYTLLLPIAPNDFWYNARAGAELASGRHPTTALFTTSVAPDTPYFYQSWIAQWLLFKTLQLGGLSGIVILRTVLLTLSFALLQWAAWRRIARISPATPATTRARIAALSTLLCFALAASNMDFRPQTFSVPLFCIFAFCIFEWSFWSRSHQWLATIALVALMALWANTHGAFFTGLLLLAVFIVGEAIHSLLARRRAFSMTSVCGAALKPAGLIACGVLFVLALLATFYNPRGVGLYSYVLLLARFEANQKFIQEWQAPNLQEWYGVLFFATLMLSVLLIATVLVRSLSSRRVAVSDGTSRTSAILGVRLSELLILGALAIMALRDVRSIIWFGFFAAPVVAALLTRLSTNHSAPQADSVPRSAQLMNAGIGFILILSIAPLLPQFKTNLKSSLPPEFLQSFAPTPRADFPVGFPNDSGLLLSRDTPVEAVEYLRRNPPRGKLWNDFVYGSYLVWSTLSEPRLAPWADPRVEMRPLEFWVEYGKVSNGEAEAARSLATQGFSDVLLDTREQPQLRKVLLLNGWREVFRQGRSVVLRQNVAE